jgi:hypothetical protein
MQVNGIGPFYVVSDGASVWAANFGSDSLSTSVNVIPR